MVGVDTKGSKTAIEGDVKVIQVDYSNHDSIKHGLTGVDVVISTISWNAIDVQGKIAAAGKEAGMKFFVPSEFGVNTEGETEGIFGAKANIQAQLRASGVPFAAFYTGPFAEYVWASYVLSCLWLFRSVDHRTKGSWASISRAGKCPSVTMATSRLRSPRDPILRDMFLTS